MTRQGTLSGGSITGRKRDQQWTLNQTGNWELDKVDLNGDGDFVDTNEVNDDRTFNAVNELTARDTDDNGTDNYTLTYDEVGNLRDDGENYTYEWDAFGRLRKVKNRSTSALVCENRYNGLHHRIAYHEDSDADSDVDGNDKWYYLAYDRIWRWVATFRENDTSPKEEFVYHAAGYEGVGSGSFIDLVLFRDKDANTAWTSAADGTLEERVYYLGNQRPDVSVLVTSAGAILEWAKYSAYGMPFGLPGGDTDSDGDCDSADVTQIQNWADTAAYDVRGDSDLDGDVDAADKSTVQGTFQGISLGRGRLSANAVANPRGATYSAWTDGNRATYGTRRRQLNAALGMWVSRDPIEYAGGRNLYQGLASNPVRFIDPMGLATCSHGIGWPLFIDPPGSPIQSSSFYTSAERGGNGIPDTSPFMSVVMPLSGQVEWALVQVVIDDFPQSQSVSCGLSDPVSIACTWKTQLGLNPRFKAPGAPCPRLEWTSVFCAGDPEPPVAFRLDYTCSSPCGEQGNELYKTWHGVDCPTCVPPTVKDAPIRPIWFGENAFTCNGSSQCYLNDDKHATIHTALGCGGQVNKVWQVIGASPTPAGPAHVWTARTFREGP